jgi:hypothetical protein
MRELTKSLKRKLREQSMVAHEEELRRILLQLSGSFDEWKQGKVSGDEMVERVHIWHDGPARELWKKYNYGDAQSNVAHAIVTGVVDVKKVDPQLVEFLQPIMEMFQEQLRPNAPEP